MPITTFRELGSCELELVPDDGVELSGSNLILWRDKAMGRNASVANAIADGYATATGPIFEPNDPGFGGRPSITYGTPNTSCLATAVIPDVAAPMTFVVAGQMRGNTQAGAASGRVLFDKLAATTVNGRSSWFLPSKANSTAGGGPFDSLAFPWAGSTPVATNPRRVVGANARAPFVQIVIVRSATEGVVIHNGVVCLQRAMTAVASPFTFRGLRLGRDFGNTISGQEWQGPFSLFALWSRELTFSECRDVLSLASAKTGIPVVTGRVAA